MNSSKIPYGPQKNESLSYPILARTAAYAGLF